MRLNNFSKLVLSIGLSEIVGIVGSVFAVSEISSWYVTLHKPAINPPNWIFGPVWTTLYLLMGMSAFLVWRKGLERKDVRRALKVFGIQLIINCTWSIIFFRFHNPALALVDIVLMGLFIVWTMILFFRVSKSAMYLLVPYLVWVSFAGYLNYAIWKLN